MREPFMTFQIEIRGGEVSGFSSPDGSVTFIPFGGRVDSPLFRGEIRPGAADVQIELPGEARLLTARYLFTGTDGAGMPCSLYVENTGRVGPGPLRATPRFLTDSAFLRETFANRRFYTEIEGAPGGVTILVYEEA